MRLSALGIALAAVACAPVPPADRSDARSLATAESAFAARSVREDMRAAFLASFAADGVFVRGGWTAALPWLASRPAPPITLDWRPAHVEVAASGELGLSTGPWKAASRAKPDSPPVYGQFVSVWRRDADGDWKVLVDIGVSHPGPLLWDAPLEITPPSRDAADPATLEAAEHAFAEDAARDGLAAAYARHGSQRLRLYRSGQPPAIGKAQALAALVPDTSAGDWRVEAWGTSRAGDFGHARGRHGTAPRDGAFLRVWRAEGHAWRIVLDVVDEAR